MAIGMKEADDTEEKIQVNNLDTELDSPKTANKNSIIIIAVVAVIIIIIIGMLKSALTDKEQITMVDDGTNPTNNTIATTSEQAETTEENPDALNVGLPEFDPKDNGQTSAVVYSASDYVKDLNGSDIPAVYEVASRTYVRDFVNYEAKRAILADGMEMYWLEIVYKNKPYRCQVPFYIFKDLETTGICVVEIELLTLEGGEQVISFMQVVSDYGDLINK